MTGMKMTDGLLILIVRMLNNIYHDLKTNTVEPGN